LPRWGWAVQASQLRSAPAPYVGGVPPGELSWALVDYSPLSALDAQTLGVVHTQTLDDNPEKIENRAILLGDASEPQHHDNFNVGDLHPQPLGGVYLHACAALTAQGNPLLELTHEGRLSIDIGVSLVILLVISAIRLFYSWHRPSTEVQVTWLYGCLTSVAILAACLFAVGLIRYTRVIWTDFTAVSLGLLFHLFLHHRVGHLPRALALWWNNHVAKERLPNTQRTKR
jgi:CHASE2 domain-containing sensor protein